MHLTEKERERWNAMKKGTYYGQVGITIRFGNDFWLECAGTFVTALGDNSPSIVVAKSGRHSQNIINKRGSDGCYPINSMVIGKDGGNGDRQTFGIGADGDPCPTIQTCHHHAVALTRRNKA